jgi:hypothetical protein
MTARFTVTGRVESGIEAKRSAVTRLRASIYTPTSQLTPQPPPSDDLEVRQSPTLTLEALIPLNGMTSDIETTARRYTLASEYNGGGLGYGSFIP